MSFFKNIPLAPPDPILSLTPAFLSDSRKQKVNLGVGAYKTDVLEPFILESVRKAEQFLIEEKINKEYLPIEGLPDFISHITPLVLGEKAPTHRIFVAQTIGGTGALRVGGQFLANYIGKKIYIPIPTWDNHSSIFSRAGMDVQTYPYYSSVKKDIDFSALCKAVTKMPSGSSIVLHGCCHNPTGCDPTFEQWKELATLIKARSLLPFFDFAYQGFGKDLSSDAEPIRHFVTQEIECLIAVSFSKNFGLYGERIGALFVASEEESLAKKVGSQIKATIRSLYSNPPSHGARIVATILKNPSLRPLWEKELISMRTRIQVMREKLVERLSTAGASSFLSLKKQKGMFSYSGLSIEQVRKLKEDYGIYLPLDGRISLSGLNDENLSYVCDAILSVMQEVQ